MGNVSQVWNQARDDPAGPGPYAEQVARMFAHQPAVLEELLGGLFHIAKADGVVHPAELEYLSGIASIFGFSPPQFERIRAIHLGSAEGTGAADPHEVLRVSRDASDEEIKKAYRKLSREYHPDTLTSQGLPQEFIDLANEKMAAINGAYATIRKGRGMK